jgi:ubiquinone biosynthesis protein COQ9
MATKYTLQVLKPRTPFLKTLKYLPNPRKYHSYDHPPPPGPFNASESLILSSAAQHIPIHGFTQKTLSLGAKDAGYIDASVNLFPKGEFELVRWWLWSQRMQLAGRWAEVKGEKGEDGTGGKGQEMGVGQKVKALTWERLMGNREVVGRWQEVCLPTLFHIFFHPT